MEFKKIGYIKCEEAVQGHRPVVIKSVLFKNLPENLTSGFNSVVPKGSNFQLMLCRCLYHRNPSPGGFQ